MFKYKKLKFSNIRRPVSLRRVICEHGFIVEKDHILLLLPVQERCNMLILIPCITKQHN